MKKIVDFLKEMITLKTVIIFIAFLVGMQLFEIFNFYLYEKGIEIPFPQIDPMLGFLIIGFLTGINFCRIYYDYKKRKIKRNG